MVIVDDHAAFRESAAALLEADGFTIVGEAADGVSALALVDGVRPEVVLLDVQLPGWMASRSLSGWPQCVTPVDRADLQPRPLLVRSPGGLPPYVCGFVSKDELSGGAITALFREPGAFASVALARGIALGLVAESRLYGWNGSRSWIPDLLAGWTLLACGLVGWSRRPRSWSGPLLAAAGFSWFVPNIAVGLSGWLAAHTLYLHRGPLVQLALTYPQGRPRGRLLRLVLAAGWLAAMTTIWRNEAWTIVSAVALIGFAHARYRAPSVSSGGFVRAPFGAPWRSARCSWRRPLYASQRRRPRARKRRCTSTRRRWLRLHSRCSSACFTNRPRRWPSVTFSSI